MNKTRVEKEIQLIATLQRDINLALVFLLLSGQLTVKGLFITSGGFSLTLSGPIIGGFRIEGKPWAPAANTIIDLIDVIISILLIIDAIRLTGVLVGPGRISLTVSGPIFGVPLNEPSPLIARETLQYYHQMISAHFDLDPRLFRNLERK